MQVFISYKREDEAFARQLSDMLMSWGYSSWLDVKQIRPNDDWDSTIHHALQTSEIVLGVMTPESLESPNVLDEWDYALRTEKRLFILWLRDVPEASIPPRYGRRQRIDCRTDLHGGLANLCEALASPVKILEKPHNSAPRVSTASQTREIKPKVVQDAKLSDRNRERMLGKVRTFWVEGVLEQSLHNAILLELGMVRHPTAVQNPWDSILQHPDYGDYKLPPDTKITDVFHALNGELLILGEPGSGKTTTLLELAKHRIDSALTDNTQPIPVIFNLSSWAEERWPLATWLIDELNTKYQIPKRVGQEWIESDDLTLLLDGLDEVAIEHRGDCINEINEFRAVHTVDLVVCSRIADYEALTTKLQLQGAIVLQPLNPIQVENYLSHFGDELTSIRSLIREDTTLREMLQSPLMLSILMLAYRGMPEETLQRLDTVEVRRRHLFETYVQRAFERKGLHPLYSLGQTTFWLGILAQRMVQQSETVFFIERMQPSWLTRKTQQVLFAIGVRLILGIVGGLAVGIGTGIVFTLAGGTQLGITVGIIVGLLALLTFCLFWGWGGGLAIGSAGGMAFGMTFGLVAGLAAASQAGWLWGIAWGLLFVLAGGLFFNLVGVLITLLIGRKLDYRHHISVAEILTWSWSEALLGLAVGLVLGVVGGAVAELIFKTGIGFFFSLILGIAFGIVLMPGFGLAGREVEMRTVPNQGIRRSVQLALQFGISTAVLVGVFTGLAGGPAVAVIMGVIGGSVGFMTFGGIAFSQHIFLRLMLYIYHDMPWNYARFLDFCAERVLLRKVGGGYIFIHRYLLEYFAALNSSQSQ